MRIVWGAKPLTAAVLVLLALLGSAVSVVYAATSKPDFSLAVSAASQSVMQGQSTSTTVTVSSLAGLTGTVSLSASGTPAGATAALQPSSVTLTSSATTTTSTLAVTTASSTPAGTYAITVSAVSGTIKHSVSVSLTVNYALNGAFTVAAAPSAGTVTPGGYAASVVTITRTSPFTGAVALSVYGTLPTGVTASFTPATVPSTGTSSTLQLSTTTSTPVGSSAIYIVGTYTDPATNAKYYQYAQTTLTVVSGGKPFTISGNLSGGAALSPGTSSPLNLLLTNPNPQTLTVTNLTITVASTSAGAACAPSNFSVTAFTRYPLTLAGNSTVTLSQAGIAAVDLPRIGLIDLPQNQDGCRGVGINIAYSGTAQGN